MKYLQRFIYLVYYIKELNFERFKKFLKYSSKLTGRSALNLLLDSLYSVFKYNISLDEYFKFRFFSKDNAERNKWAGTGYMYEYQLKMNPLKFRKILENKLLFNEFFSTLIKRHYYKFQELSSDNDLAEKFIRNPVGKIVIKNSLGQAGGEVKVISCNGLSVDHMLKIMIQNKYDMAEEFIVQHQDLMNLSPSGVNTVRIVTQIFDKNIEIIAARLRISINSEVDNMAASNAAAPVNLKTGVVNGPAVFSDITREDLTIHPVTGVPIIGFQIPFWEKVLDLAKTAASMTMENRSVGWDIAINSEGPLLIEGNHNWCKSLWQLPVKEGLKWELDSYS
jgi:hypothetical protein